MESSEAQSQSKISAAERPRSMQSFFVIWIGQIISLLGSGLTGFALGVWIFERTGQATPFAITVLFASLPRILLLPVAGSLADRWNRRWIMILADTGSALVTLAVIILLSIGSLDIWHIYLLAITGSVFGAFQEPAYSASITMLVPKKNLARANGLVYTGQALESILTPLIAGLLFVSIGLRGIILIDFVTYFFALGALLITRIPQPEIKTDAEGTSRGNLIGDMIFGWRYLRTRTGLFGLLLYFAMVNFLLNFAAVLIGPIVLSRHPASVLGVVQTVWGVGMLLGSIVMSAWGGPKRRVPVIIGLIGVSAFGLVIAGWGAHPAFMASGLFLLMSVIPIASGLSQAVFQTKVAPDVQGRVFSMRSLISRSMMPIAFLSAGPLADLVFEPVMRDGGMLAVSLVGSLIGTGPGRGMGLMYVIAGLAGVTISLLVYANPRIRMLEDELPDAVADQDDKSTSPA